MDSGVPGERCLQLLPEGEGTYSGFWAAAQAMAAADDAAPAGRGDEDMGAPEGRPEGVPEREEESEEIAPPALVHAPANPTRAEVDEHESTGHVQYRTWCRHCVAGRGLGQQHRSRDEESKRDDGLPIIASDYTFMTTDGKEDGRAKPILVIKDSRTLSVAAAFVDAKCPTPYAVKFFANFLKHLGYRRAVMMSDGEHSIVALKEQAAREAGVENVPQESPVGDHRSNGLAENAVREVKRQVRVLRSSLEEMIGKVLREDDPVLAWLPRHAADLMCRYRKGPDGRTPEHRRCGKNWRKPAIAIGEKLYYREVGEGVRHLKEGRYIGHHGRTGSVLVITADAVKRGTGVRRLADCDRWVADGWDALRGLPWEVTARRSQGTPGAGAAGEAVVLVGEPRMEVPPAVHVMAPPMQKRIYIRKADVEKYTPTDGCPGCTCILLGQSTVLPHTEACRARIVTLMQQDEEGKSRLEEHERKKRSKRDEKNEAPERDVTADDAAGAPADKAVQASEERRDEGILPYPDNPEERSSLKRAPAEPSSSSTPAGSKAKASPVKPGTQDSRWT